MSRKKNISKFQKQQKLQQQKNQKKKRNRIILYAVATVLVLATLISVLVGVLSGDDENKAPAPTVYGDGKVDTSDAVKVALEVKDYGKITLELYPNEAPITVENFLNYVEEGFYDGLIFHRVIENFMIQGGDPTGTGYGDSSLKTIKGEFYSNGVDNDLTFERGVIGMARSDAPNSASSQFFIMHQTTSTLNGNYAAFGKVVDGMAVVDAIAACDKTNTVDSYGNRYIPAETVKIEKAYIVK